MILHRFDVNFDPEWKNATSSILETDFNLQVDSSEEAIFNIYITYTAIIEGPHYLFGKETQSIGENSLTTGRGTIALGDFQFVTGKYNQSSKDAIFIIGNGSDDNNRSNLMEVGDNLIRIGKSEAGNLIITQDGDIKVRDSLTELATFGASGVTLGKAGEQRIMQTSSGLNFIDERDYILVNERIDNGELVIYNDLTKAELRVGNGVKATFDNLYGITVRAGQIIMGDSAVFRLDGDTFLTLETTTTSGTDHDLYTAITALGWQNNVIET